MSTGQQPPSSAAAASVTRSASGCISTSPSTCPDLARVPAEYHDLQEVFSKVKAITLPPHRPHDCGIDLKTGTSPPKGRLYSLSGQEREAMENYINDSLAAGIIRPSSSPAGAGFFFVDKKDKSLRGLPGTKQHHYQGPAPSSPHLLHPTTCSASGRGTSGRLHSTPPPDIMNIW